MAVQVNRSLTRAALWLAALRKNTGTNAGMAALKGRSTVDAPEHYGAFACCAIICQ
jgi:hypothetical protein